MGADIHWIVERRAANGEWMAVSSKSATFDQLYPDDERLDSNEYERRRKLLSESGAMDIGDRDYTLFGLLSGVRCKAPDDGQMADDGMPGDASSYAETQFDDDCDLHSHGNVTGERILEWAAAEPFATYDEREDWRSVENGNVRAVAHWARAVSRHVLSDACDAPIHLKGRSAHERIAQFTENPIPKERRPEEWRILICYDN
jgi:hypothetical protein